MDRARQSQLGEIIPFIGILAIFDDPSQARSTTTMINMPPAYNPAEIESSRQAAWAASGSFDTPEPGDGQLGTYIKPSSPFTSGELHLGHVRSYSISDAYARFRRACGDAVLFSLGFDAFGLPAELEAMKHNESPADWVSRCGDRMRVQMEGLGFSFDYKRFFYTSDPILYQWSQWLFLTLLDAGLVYRAEATVDWCESCETTLAALQVTDGKCWRCSGETRLKRLPQWFFRIAPYIEENHSRLAELFNWDGASLSAQRFLLGRTDGVEIELEGHHGRTLVAFTPYRDALEQASFVILSPRHPQIENWIRDDSAHTELNKLRSGGWDRNARNASLVPVVSTGLAVIGITGRELPVLISPIVDARVGPTAVLGIPQLDDIDHAIAERMAFVQTPSPPRSKRSAARPTQTVRYRAWDFPISRQRSWGTPIPIVNCPNCGVVPVPRRDLPVILPPSIKPTAKGNPLAGCSEFLAVSCPKCGVGAQRETDTLDCHFDGIWKWIPPCVPPLDRSSEMFGHPALKKWLPAERLVGGADVGGFVFDQRILTKILRDLGPLSFLDDGEPFSGSLLHEMVLNDGRKMSKHLGNAVDPNELVRTYGADTVRLAILYAAGPTKSLSWTEGAVRFAARFLNSLWHYTHEQIIAAAQAVDDQEAAVDTAFIRRRLSNWCDSGTQRITVNLRDLQMHKAVRNLTRLFERIKDYERRIVARQGHLTREDFDALLRAISLLAQLLSPFAPHMAETLLLALGRPDGPDVCGAWPVAKHEPKPTVRAVS